MSDCWSGSPDGSSELDSLYDSAANSYATLGLLKEQIRIEMLRGPLECVFERWTMWTVPVQL